MEFSNLIKERYSVRDFSNAKVEEEKLAKIMEAGMVAPSAKNQQPIKVYLLKSQEAVENANKISPCMYGATVAFLVCFDQEKSFKKNTGLDFGVQDASICCTHMMLEAKNQGLGSCWVGLIDEGLCHSLLEIPQNIKPIALLPIGYETQGGLPSERHFIRKSKEEIFEVK